PVADPLVAIAHAGGVQHRQPQARRVLLVLPRLFDDLGRRARPRALIDGAVAGDGVPLHGVPEQVHQDEQRHLEIVGVVDAALADASETERVQALTAAARACDKLDDADGARDRLERAVAHEVPGVTEPAMFELAERLRERDRARALSLYYRAAAGAEKHRAG